MLSPGSMWNSVLGTTSSSNVCTGGGHRFGKACANGAVGGNSRPKSKNHKKERTMTPSQKSPISYVETNEQKRLNDARQRPNSP